MANLECPILKDVETGQIIEISRSPFTIGRSLASDYVLADKMISKAHCNLVKSHEDGWALRDLSTNGTMVNEDIYHRTSCILKNNDEICLGSNTYIFLMESNAAAPNPQVEMLRSQASVSPGGASGNSFDDNGVSDDILNNLADNILKNIDEALEQSNAAAENNAAQDIINFSEDSSLATKQCDESIYKFNNILDPVELMLKPTQFNAGANVTDLAQVVGISSKNYTNLEETIQGSNIEYSILSNLLSSISEVKNLNPSTVEQNNSHSTNAEELPSSDSTIIYASPGCTNYVNLLPTGGDQNIVESNSSAVPGSSRIEQFKMHFDQTLDEVVRKYTVPDGVTSTTTNNLFSNNSNSGVVSPLNANKKVKVSSATATDSSGCSPFASNSANIFRQTVSSSGNVSRPVYSSSFRFSLTQPPQSATSRLNVLPSTVVVPEQMRRVVPINTAHNTNLDVIDLTHSQNYLTSTSVNAGYGVPIGSTATGSLLPFNNSVPATVVSTDTSNINHEMVDGDNAATSGDKVSASETPSSDHSSQKPSTSKEPDKQELSKLGTNAQNQYEEMENELMCTICACLFIKAVTLGCSHSFCQYCIDAWKKKKSDCPICRNPITSTIRTLVLDNIIEKMLETATLEDKTQRNEAIEERRKIEEAEKAAKSKHKNKNNGRARNTARRGRRNARNNNNARAAPQPAPQPQPAQIIQIIDTGDSDSDENDYGYGYDYDYDNYYDDEWYNGVEGAYYGGFGRCYICGTQGHWANGCPFR